AVGQTVTLPLKNQPGSSLLPLLWVKQFTCPARATPFPYTTLFRSRTGGVPVEWVTHEELKARSAAAVAIVRTGELTSYANVLLRSEEHTSELKSRENLVCRLRHGKKKKSSSSTGRLGAKLRMMCV